MTPDGTIKVILWVADFSHIELFLAINSPFPYFTIYQEGGLCLRSPTTNIMWLKKSYCHFIRLTLLSFSMLDGPTHRATFTLNVYLLSLDNFYVMSVCSVGSKYIVSKYRQSISQVLGSFKIVTSGFQLNLILNDVKK